MVGIHAVRHSFPEPLRQLARGSCVGDKVLLVEGEGIVRGCGSHMFLKFLITYRLWHGATGKVDSTSGLVMPCAYYSAVVGFQQFAS